MERLTLTQAARALRVPQHKLIHLCEKRVVVPDLDDAHGRGSSRGFSYRNLFEFAVALEMRRLELPLAVIRAVLIVLRSFESAAASAMPGFSLPQSLQIPGAPSVVVLLLDGEHLYFSVRKDTAAPVLFGTVELPKRGTRSRRASGVDVRRLSSAAATKATATAKIRTEIDLTRIAGDLPNPES